jgi:hypothetical protein
MSKKAPRKATRKVKRTASAAKTAKKKTAKRKAAKKKAAKSVAVRDLATRAAASVRAGVASIRRRMT